MTETIFEEMGGTYRQVRDYLLPKDVYKRQVIASAIILVIQWFMGNGTINRWLAD